MVPSAMEKRCVSCDTDKRRTINELTDPAEDARERPRFDDGVNAGGGQ